MDSDSLVIDNAATSQTISRPVLTSSTHLHRFSPARVVVARREADIVDAVESAAAQQLPIRAIGVMHSYAPIFATRGVCLVLEKYNQLLKVEPHQVTVQAGMTISDLNEQLAQRGLALPVVSAIDLQTISGAISTGTHGGSLHCPSLSGYVRALRLVRADGSVVELQPGEEAFDAAAISMGLLGIISTVTIACVPSFRLVAQPRAYAFEDFIQQFDAIHQRNQYLDVKYVPITDRIQVLAINQMTGPTTGPMTGPITGPMTGPSADLAAHPAVTHAMSGATIRKVKTHILKKMLALFQRSRWRWLQYLMYKRHENNIYSAYQCDRSDLIFTNLEQSYYDPIPLHNMEIAVSYTQATTVLQTLRQHFQHTKRYPNIFIRIRVSAAEPFWLSPAYHRATCWFDFCEYPYSGNFFREVVALLEPYNFRSHWGKEIQAQPGYLKSQYEKWSDFVSLRHQWDPERLFSNHALDPFFTYTHHEHINR